MKDTLQITLSKVKLPNSKLGKWLYWNVYFRIWKVWRPKLLAKFYYGLSNFFFMFLPKVEKEKALKELENIDVIIKDETKNEKN